MSEKLRKFRPAVDLYERLDAIPISEVERIQAKAHLARAEHIAEIFARAVAAVKNLMGSRRAAIQGCSAPLAIDAHRHRSGSLGDTLNKRTHRGAAA